MSRADPHLAVSDAGVDPTDLLYRLPEGATPREGRRSAVLVPRPHVRRRELLGPAGAAALHRVREVVERQSWPISEDSAAGAPASTSEAGGPWLPRYTPAPRPLRP